MVIGLLILSIAISLGLGFYVYRLKTQDREIISINEERQRQNQAIENEITLKKKELDGLKEVITTQQSIVQSLNTTAEDLRQGAEERAQQEYESKAAALAQKFNKMQEELENNFSSQRDLYNEQLAEQLDKVNDLKAKQLAYIQAQQREEEKQSNIDYYRLVISNSDKNEISMLRNIQLQFVHKDAIDKLIWEVYYKPAFDILVSHVYNSASKICGIYKITNLENGQAYIGQSVDCKERARQHIKAGLSSSRATNKLYQQMQDDGLYNFTFEVLEEVPREKLNERETYWIDFYKTKEYGMNGTKGGA